MKLARIDKDGKILEIFEKENINSKLSRELILQLKEVPSDAEVSAFFLDGQYFGKPESSDFVLEKGKWVKSQEAIEREQENEKIALIRERLKNVNSANSVAALRAHVQDILTLLNLNEDE